MVLAAGTRLGPYEILAPIGAGGMGEVYRARDRKLKREVALKVLPEAFASDPERMARFQREAEVLASLNHPNIAQIYGVEERALVMELVEGESPKGPMALDDAWKIASQMAAGLEYAHDKGIVHRDLKPANVKITPNGVVKLLDFGLAKAFTGQPAASGNLENSPTLTLGATQLGVILGTAAYMAPEQAKGKTVDKRADIWSFGVVLYELLTGERLFTGDDVSDTLAQVLMKQPDLDRVPVQARRLLRECFQKDPKDRLRDIGDARRVLMEVAQPASPPAAVASLRSRFGIVASAAVVLALALAALALVHFREKPPEAARAVFEIVPPGDVESDPVLSPDGRHLAFVARGPGRAAALWVRSLDSSDVKALPGTEGSVPAVPFWSADSRSLAFISGSDGTLRKVDIAGGLPLVISRSPGGGPAGPAGLGGTWSADGTIVLSAGRNLWRVSQGGSPVQLSQAAEGSIPFDPQFLPDGKHLIYQEVSGLADNGVYRAALDSQQRTKLISSDQGLRHGYSPPSGRGEPGHLLFVRGGTLMAQPMDPKTFALRGDAVPVADQVIGFSVSNNGLLAYRTGNAGGNVELTWFDRSGKPLGTVGPPGRYEDLALSPDGKRVAVSRSDSARGPLDLWIIDNERGVPSRFTSDPAMDWEPVWSPDGRTLAFSSGRGNGGIFSIYAKDASNVGTEQPLIPHGNLSQRPKGWSPDGKLLLFVQNSGADPSQADLWMLPMDGERKPVPFLTMPALESQGQFYPLATQGPRWVAYISNESGRNEVYVQSYPPGAPKVRVSSDGGVQPRWKRDGKELFYLGSDGKLMSAEVKRAAATFEVGASKVLFQSRMYGAIGGRTNYVFRYDVSPDGKRFLIIAEPETGKIPPITVVMNWQAGLKK